MFAEKKITKIKNKFFTALMLLALFCFAFGAVISVAHAVSHDVHQVKDFHNCALCSFSNSQNKILIAPEISLLVAAFFLVFALRNFNRVKLSYLLSSNQSRAPPKVS
jgi:hypothetical protein